MKKITGIVVSLFIAVMLIISCTSDSNPTESDNNCILSENAIVVDFEKEFLNLETTSISQNNESGLDTLVFRGIAPQSLTEGIAFVSTDTTNSTPICLIRKVEKKWMNDGKTYVKTSQCGLGDVFSKYKVNTTAEVDLGTMVLDSVFQKNLLTETKAKNIMVNEQTRDGESVFEIILTGVVLQTTPVRVTADLEITLEKLDITLEVDWGEDEHYIKVNPRIISSAKIITNCEAATNLGIEWTIPATSTSTLYWFCIPSPIGPIPIPYTVNTGLVINLSGSASSGFSVGAGIRSDLDAEYSYHNGDWDSNFKPKNTPQSPTFEVASNLSVSAFVGPAVSLRIANIVGPEVSAGPFLEVEREINYTDKIIYDRMNAGLQAGASIDFHVLGFKNLDLAYSFPPVTLCKVNIYEKESPLGGNTAPTASFTVSPSTGTLETNFEFDASSCSDEEDETSNLQVRWDFDGNGSWDTSWKTDKTENYQYSSAGNKAAKLEVKDSEGLTDVFEKNIAVLTNDNTPPTKPALKSPADNGTDIEYHPTTFKWNRSTDADGDDLIYVVKYSTNQTDWTEMDPTVWDVNMAELAGNRTYYWKVEVNDGAVSTSSDAWSFTTRNDGNTNTALLINSKENQNNYDSGFISLLNESNINYDLIDIDEVKNKKSSLSNYRVVISNMMGYGLDLQDKIDAIKGDIENSIENGTEYILGSESIALLSSLNLLSVSLSSHWSPGLNDTKAFTTIVSDHNLTNDVCSYENWEDILGDSGNILSSYFDSGVYWKVMSNYSGRRLSLNEFISYPIYFCLGISSGWSISDYEYTMPLSQFTLNNSRLLYLGNFWSADNNSHSKGWIGPEGVKILINAISEYATNEPSGSNPKVISNFTVNSSGATTKLTWEDTEHAEYYEIWTKREDGKWRAFSLIKDNNSQAYEWLFPVSNGYTYNFKIRAINKDFSGPFSE